MLKVVWFGTPQVILDQRNLTATLAGRPLALLAYLAVTDQPHDRNLLADLLWAEIGETEARRNLRNILYLLRQAVGDYLFTDRQTVTLVTTAHRHSTVYLWAQASGALRYQLTGHTGWITKVSYSPDGQLLASAATDGAINLWCVADGACVQSFAVAGPYAAMDISHCRGLTPSKHWGPLK